jgi:sugar/nucleoside kinase (ribokinase family)
MPSPGEPDVLVLGRLYCDLVFTGLTALPPPGRETFAPGLTVTAGGGAFITAAWLARLGRTPGIVSDLGDDPFSALVSAEMARRGLSDRLVARHAGPLVRTTVAMPVGGDRALLTYLADDPGRDPCPAVAASGARHLHVAELATLVAWPGVVGAARRAGMSVSLDSAWDDALMRDPRARALVGTVDLFLPNEAEACALADLPEGDAEAALAHWAERVPGVVVKLGAAGAVGVIDGRRVSAAAPEVAVVDSTGAGDAFDAGLIHALLDGEDPESALAAGVACGARAVQGPGGCPPAAGRR